MGSKTGFSSQRLYSCPGQSPPSLGLSFRLCKMGRSPGLPTHRGIVRLCPLEGTLGIILPTLQTGPLPDQGSQGQGKALLSSPLSSHHGSLGD